MDGGEEGGGEGRDEGEERRRKVARLGGKQSLPRESNMGRDVAGKNRRKSGQVCRFVDEGKKG
jgi:hypothetical protein